ncbi:MAG: hypothetical protein JWO38_6259 [Gemmataceae bacterium]|nr:hypothetical protein [Gemmataceae bacterium]
MIRRTYIARLFAATVAAVAISGSANAGIIPASVTVTPDAGNFRWTYSIVLPTNMMLQSGNYFTIYDVNGLVNGSIQAPTGWSATTGLNTPPPLGLHPHDTGLAPDITFTYNGPTIPSGQVGLGNFWFDSSIGTSTTTDFTAQNPQASTGNTDRNIVSTLAPAPPGGGGGGPTVPEPTTMALAGLGLPFIGAARLFRKKK